MPDPSPSFVEDLLERCILALEAGDHAAVERLLQEQPDAAPQLRERIDQLAALGILHAPSAPPIPEQLGEFKLLRILGRGGMGIVYLAEQTSLQRQVALKLVHPEQRFFPGARERFRREVLAVARLQHPGIVPVLTCGEAEGLPYYAMELVAGASLAEVLLELAGTAPAALDGQALQQALQRAMAKKHDHTAVADAPAFQGAWPNVCCRLALDAAEALQHAHEHGVLHRDVKPSNLLLCASGKVRLIDFGLASAEGEQRITRSGSAFGSLPYMAPEQVRGDLDGIDARTDVYALGASLYELLTLTLPHGDGSGTTRERILAGLVEAPARRNARVHPDVDAVCLLAMDLDPARRYPTAAAFADDLRAFLEQRSVRARRPSWLLRARRWAQRHPARAATAAVVFLVLGPGPLVFGVQQSMAATRVQLALDEASAQRRLAETSLAEADRLRDLAEQNLQEAIGAVEQMLFRTATDRLARHPRTVQLRRSLMEDALGFYERLLASASTAASDRRVRMNRARTQVRMGRLHEELGELPKAAEVTADAIRTLGDLLPQSTQPHLVRIELANARHRISDVLGRMDRIDEQIAVEEQAVSDFAALRAEFPKDGTLFLGTLDTRLGLAMVHGRRHEFAAGHALLDTLDTELQTGPPTGLSTEQLADWHLDAVRVADHRAVLFSLAGVTEQALTAFTSALQRFDAMPEAVRHEDEARSLHLSLLNRTGQNLLQRRQWDRAETYIEQAVRELEQRAREEPEPVMWRSQLAESIGSRATNRHMRKDTPGARADHDRAISLLEQVVSEAPTEVHHRRRLAIAMAERAGTLAATGDLAAALPDLQAADRLFAEIRTELPNDDQARTNHAAVLANMARTLAGLRRVDEARVQIEIAIQLAQSAKAGERDRALVELCGLAADLAMQDQDPEDGERWIVEAMARAAAWLQERPTDPLRLATAAMIASNRGTMLLQLDRHPEATEVWLAALPNARAAAKANPFGRQVLSVILLRLADVANRNGDLAKTREWFAAALAETNVRPAEVRGYPPLFALFTKPELRDLVPATVEPGK